MWTILITIVCYEVAKRLLRFVLRRIAIASVHNSYHKAGNLMAASCPDAFQELTANYLLLTAANKSEFVKVFRAYNDSMERLRKEYLSKL